jgi:hypothetical protein
MGQILSCRAIFLVSKILTTDNPNLRCMRPSIVLAVLVMLIPRGFWRFLLVLLLIVVVVAVVQGLLNAVGLTRGEDEIAIRQRISLSPPPMPADEYADPTRRAAYLDAWWAECRRLKKEYPRWFQ